VGAEDAGEGPDPAAADVSSGGGGSGGAVGYAHQSASAAAGEAGYSGGVARRSSSTGDRRETPPQPARDAAGAAGSGSGGDNIGGDYQEQAQFPGPAGGAGGGNLGSRVPSDQGVFEAYAGTEGLPDSPNLLLHFPDLADLPDIMPDGGAVAGVAALEPPVLPDHDQQQHMEHLQQRGPATQHKSQQQGAQGPGGQLQQGQQQQQQHGGFRPLLKSEGGMIKSETEAR
jgi:hypothetical protein